MKNCFLLSGFLAFLLSSASAHDAIQEMSSAADQFLKSLDKDQRAKAAFAIKDVERENWHFVPKPFEGDDVRKGLPMVEMRTDQKVLAHALLSSGMSHRGYSTALTIMSLEQVLFEIEQADHRNPDYYYVTVFGEPGSEAWGWRVEGHHLSLNFTISDGKIVSGTPSFFASNPGEILEGPRKGLRVLADEEDVARSLVTSLDEDQREAAVILDKAPRDILTAAETKVASLGTDGLPYSDLSKDQQIKLKELINVYVQRLRPEFAEADLKKIEKAGFENIIFAWAGGLEKGQQHYYRVQGPTFLLEYANTQNNANHVHAVWRDFDGDFGRNVLAEHFKSAH